MRTVKDIDVAHKTVLLRADYNVPIVEGEITDDYRILQSLPTVEYLLSNNCKIVIISHLGRPGGKPVAELSLQPVTERLQKLLGREVALTSDFAEVDSKTNQITMLENLRFWPGEEKNDKEFAGHLADLGEVFVQDGFGVVHRAHASTSAVTELLPSVGGLLLDKEVSIIADAMENPKRPLVAIFGGAKVSDKIELIDNFISRADKILIGGAMANTFLKYMGYNIGKSNHEEGQGEAIEHIFKKIGGYDQKAGNVPSADELSDVLGLPRDDLAIGKSLKRNEPRVDVDARSVTDDDYILDLGPESINKFLQSIRSAGTVIWNGPLGMTELPNFTQGSASVAAALKECKSSVTSIIGGGDTAGFVVNWDDDDGASFTHVSTGGGAALDFMAGKDMPGISALPG